VPCLLLAHSIMAYTDLDPGEKFLYDAYFEISGELNQALYKLTFLAPDRLIALLSLEYPHEVSAIIMQKSNPEFFNKIIEKVKEGATPQEIPHLNLDSPNFKGGANPNKP